MPATAAGICSTQQRRITRRVHFGCRHCSSLPLLASHEATCALPVRVAQSCMRITHRLRVDMRAKVLERRVVAEQRNDNSATRAGASTVSVKLAAAAAMAEARDGSLPNRLT
eukprot:CAMPEP_0119334716 /NCGR_PEP_ID=MMETSP1333-20130426/87899_1 /TAXON_ID=418940 /ORGANISM="Scyphosphaera apsteinii, Strain RCC1455" /LENGTH=111 /DNA_ID=CAMNT_0007345083 /DNA_START=137 /DNA_END=470 /DNA_ORIENTATION=-